MKIVNRDEFLETIKEGVTVVDFFADWCGPCKMLGPVLEQLSEEMTDVKFVKVNVDDEMDLAQEYGIMSIPAVFAFKNGEVAGQSIGLKSLDDMRSFVESAK